jgi:hypothetical protein
MEKTSIIMLQVASKISPIALRNRWGEDIVMVNQYLDRMAAAERKE